MNGFSDVRYEFIFENSVSDLEQRLQEDENQLLAQKRQKETDEAISRMQRENAKALADMQRENKAALSELSDKVLDGQRAAEERAVARAEKDKADALREKKIALRKESYKKRRSELNAINQEYNTVLLTSPDLSGSLPVDVEVIRNANPYDTSLPMNFVTTHPEYQQWRKSPAYDEFMARVRSGEEARIGPDYNFD